MKVKPGSRAPCVYDARPFMRSQSTTRKMPQEKYEHLLHSRRSSTISWESLSTHNCTVKDLDQKKIQEVIDIAVKERRLPRIATHSSIKEALAKLGLLIGDKLTNAAIILFCKNEDKQFIQANLKLARFKGLTKSEFLDNKVLRGHAFDLYEHAMSFLDFNLPVAARIEEGNPHRIQTPAIPYKVLREALVNALCHRDYSIAGGSIAVAIYDDRVEIGSTGLLPHGVKVSQLKKQHLSILRNPQIANVFYLCAMIERWGRGTQEIVELCKEAGNPPPEFEETTGSLLVTLPFREPIERIMPTKYHNLSTELTTRQKKILQILIQGPMSREEIVATLKEKTTPRTVQRDLSKLKENGLVFSNGKSRSIIWMLQKI